MVPFWMRVKFLKKFFFFRAYLSINKIQSISFILNEKCGKICPKVYEKKQYLNYDPYINYICFLGLYTTITHKIKFKPRQFPEISLK